MATPTYKLSIMTPGGRIFSEQVESLTAPGALGSFGVYAHHAPMVTELTKGILRVQRPNKEDSFLVNSGVLEVDGQHNVIVLVDQAVPHQHSTN